MLADAKTKTVPTPTQQLLNILTVNDRLASGHPTDRRRRSGRAADGPAQVYVLGSIALAALPAELKLELCLLSMRYMSHRLDHVANRIWETRCVSI